MQTFTRETIFNGLCLGICVAIGTMTSMGLLGVNPNAQGNIEQICKHYGQSSAACKRR